MAKMQVYDEFNDMVWKKYTDMYKKNLLFGSAAWDLTRGVEQKLNNMFISPFALGMGPTYDPEHHYNVHTLAAHYGTTPEEIVEHLDKFDFARVKYSDTSIFHRDLIEDHDVKFITKQYAEAGGLFKHLVAEQ